MTRQQITWALIMIPCMAFSQKIQPVTRNASVEARALLTYIQSLGGKHILSGQHNFPSSGDRNTRFAGDLIGKTPVVWSQDFGFAREGDKDSYLARPAIIKEAIAQHKKGAIVTLCWHAVPPTADEPVTFQPLPTANPLALASVQGKLTNEQFADILTPGTKLNKQWLTQVDLIAGYLLQLQDAHVPVLWRPYHEMNGDWFWWGGRYEGKYTTAALYRQIFDRLVNYHKLTNLIWVWSVDRPSKAGREFANYYPGAKYLDILSIDIYGNDFNQSYYDGLVELAEGKPVVLGEVGNPPAPDILETQPKWAYWVVWAGMARGTSGAAYEKLANDPRPLFMEDAEYIQGTSAYRQACGLDPLLVEREADFTGEWLLNECESNIQSAGPSGTPYKLGIRQKFNELTIKSTSLVEWADDESSDERYTLDGKDMFGTAFNNAVKIQHANWSPEKDTLIIDSKVSFKFGDKPVEVTSKDVWHLRNRGKKLVVIKTIGPFMGDGEKTSMIVYNKQR